MIEFPYFEELIYWLIAINSMLLMLDEPVLTDKYTKDTIKLIIDVVSFIYVVECLIKIVAMGFIAGEGGFCCRKKSQQKDLNPLDEPENCCKVGRHTYIYDSFNLFDFIIVGFTVGSFVLENYTKKLGIKIGAAKAFRSLRALRPLKLVSKSDGMKIVVSSLLTAIPNLMNVLMISLLFFTIFAILSVQLLAGKVSYCSAE
jgi:hypothetical protein